MIKRKKPVNRPSDTFIPGVNTKYDPFRPLTPRKTDITVILDRSGSMGSIRDSTESGFNEFLADQKRLEGEVTISLYQFDSEYDVVYKSLPIQDAPPLRLEPRGMTALNDAMGKTIKATEKRILAIRLHERPDNVIILILTDGAENHSRKYTTEQVALMVQHQKDAHNWKFIFVGANQDAVLTAKNYNIGRGQSLSYAANHTGAINTYSIVSDAVEYMRGTGKAYGFTDSDREEAMEDGND